MFNREIFQKALEEYKKEFDGYGWKKERYKWVAIQHFQDNWDINAKDFHKMLEVSLSKTENLLTSLNHFPKAMILGYAKEEPDAVREMFRNLFDEEVNIVDRINEFKNEAKEVNARVAGEGKSHYQTENSISTYLWLKYPDKYYIYKFSEKVIVSKKLESNYKFKKGAYKQNLKNAMEFYNEINEEIKKDDELIEILKTNLDSECYKDPEFRTLTLDFGFYVSRYFDEDNKNEWYPSDYSPKLSKEDWLEVLKDESVFTIPSLEIMKRIKELDGETTCEKLSKKYGKDPNFYYSESLSLGKRIHNKTNCPIPKDKNEENKWWPILYLGKNIDKEISGSFLWKLRDELNEALNEMDLININLYAKTSPEDKINNLEIYTKEDFLKDVYMEEANYDALIGLLKNKMNIILQGPPGVGKTYAAKRLAYSIIGEKDDSRIEFIQFHQNYSYEDFIMGYKPDGESFKLRNGIFYDFCKKAKDDPKRDYFFIIDEINRGNLSKIFGELMLLIEKGYRDTNVTLAYSGQSFTVPSNLYIIAMMNTADRSLAMIDYALRRRFSFFDMEPSFDSEGFKLYQKKLDDDVFNNLIDEINMLNREIREDNSLGEGFQIGHSYFCEQEKISEEWVNSIINFDIVPTLNEYWFDEKEKVEKWKNNLMDVING